MTKRSTRIKKINKHAYIRINEQAIEESEFPEYEGGGIDLTLNDCKLLLRGSKFKANNRKNCSSKDHYNI